MSKTVKITAILGMVMYLGYIFIGKLIVPLVAGLLSRQARFISGPAVAIYVGVQMIGIVSFIVFIVFSILAIVSSNSDSSSIGGEVAGLILLDAIHPILAGIVSLILSMVLYRGVGMLYIIKPQEGYAGYSLLANYSNYLAPMGVMARFLLTIALVTAACRKKSLAPIPNED